MSTALLVVTALVVVSGVGAALALAPPGAMAIETRIAVGVGLGYALVAGVAITLALGRALSRPTFVVVVAVATVAVWALALRRASPRAHAAAIVAEAREAPFALAAGFVVLAGVALTWPFYPPGRNLGSLAPWRYWADGLEVAAAGRVPPTADQWGGEIPKTVDKVVLDAFEGGVSFLIGPDPLPAMHAILAVSAFGLAAVLLALGRELGLRAFAPLVPAFALLFPGRLPLSGEFARDLITYKGENIGRVAAFSALLVGMYLLRERGGRTLGVLGVLVGVVLALAALTHGVSAVVAGVMFALYAVAMVVADRRRWRHALASGAIVIAVSAVGYFGMIGLSRGDLGFQRVTTGPTYAGFPRDIDPTRSFIRAEVVRLGRQEGHFFIRPEKIVRRYAKTTVGGPHVWGGALVLAALAAATVVILVVARRFLSLAVVAWGLLATLVAGALFFSYRYRTQIPADFGERRLYDYAVLPPALVVPAALELLALSLLRRRPVVVGAVALAGAALAVAAAVDRIPEADPRARGAAGLDVIEHVADVVPCGARMLPNGRTAGTWQATTGRRSVIEGHAPYLRPEIMGRVLPTLIGAKEFFRDPAANRAFLGQHEIDYVVVVRRGARLGGHPDVFAGTDAAAIAALPKLRRVSRTRRVTIFAVGSSNASRAGGQPRRCPM